MKAYSIIASLVVITLMISPVIALSSMTNLSALAKSDATGKYLFVYNGPLSSGDGYDFGNCTYWVAILRAKIGDPIPKNWGNAIDWATSAKADGYNIDQQPSYGAIMQDPNAPGGLGHVAFVESVNPDTGDWTISEMNSVGFDEVDTRTLTSLDATEYNFIHDRTF